MGEIIQRGEGNKAGPDIIDSALTTRESRIVRGRHAINDSTSRSVIHGSILSTKFVRPGSICEINKEGITRRGQVKTFSFEEGIQGRNISVSAQVILEVPNE